MPQASHSPSGQMDLEPWVSPCTEAPRKCHGGKWWKMLGTSDKIQSWKRIGQTSVSSLLNCCSFSRLLPAAQRVEVEEVATVRTDPVARSGPEICCQELLGESWNGMGTTVAKALGVVPDSTPLQHQQLHQYLCTYFKNNYNWRKFDNNAAIHVTQLPSTVLQHLKQLTRRLLHQHLLQLPGSMLGTEELLKTSLEAHRSPWWRMTRSNELAPALWPITESRKLWFSSSWSWNVTWLYE